MKKIILCMLVVVSLIFQTMGVVSAAGPIQSVSDNDFEIIIRSEIPNADLSGIIIDVYAAQIAFTDVTTGYVEYDEEFAFSVETGKDGRIAFNKPSNAFSVTVRLETLPDNLGINNHTQFFTPEVGCYEAVLEEIVDVDIERTSGEVVPYLYDINGNIIYADAEVEVLINEEESLYRIDEQNKRISYNETVIVSINENKYSFSENIVQEYSDNYGKIKFLYADGLISEDEYFDDLCQHILDDSLLSNESELLDGTELYWKLRNYAENHNTKKTDKLQRAIDKHTTKATTYETSSNGHFRVYY